jgi:RecB family exonuclease
VTAHAPAAKALTRLSPSSFETLRACPLRLAFATQGDGGGSVSSDRQRIGQICHDVLESLVRDGRLRSESWSEPLESCFLELLASNEDEMRAAVRGSRLALARLRKVAARMGDFLRQVPPDAQILTEEELTAADGRLYGRVDLIVRSAELHVIVDYKTGSFLEPGTEQLKESYERQLMLYACLEAEASGAWPEQALLVPFGAEPVTLRMDPTACLQLLEEVLAALDRWQTWVGGPPPASASPETCGWCPFAARCPAFWAACNTDWADELVAIRGPLASIATTPLGGITLRLDSTEGSVLGATAVRNIEPTEFDGLADLDEGHAVSFVGLRRDPSEGVFTTRPAARFSLG